MGPAAIPGRFLSCACFFTDNLFVPRYGLHLRYSGDPEQLRNDYGQVNTWARVDGDAFPHSLGKLGFWDNKALLARLGGRFC